MLCDQLLSKGKREWDKLWSISHTLSVVYPSSNHTSPKMVMKPITLLATLWYYFANGLEEEASTSTFLRGGGGSGEKHVKLLAIEEAEGVESSNVATNYGNDDDHGMKLHGRKLQIQFLLWDWELCSINSQCSSGCCSGTYSGGVFQCTPSIYAICSAGAGSDGSGGVSLGDWEFCTTKSQCKNGCCSNQFSNDGMLKCTPGGCGGSGGVAGGEETPSTPTISPPTTSTPPSKLDIVEVIGTVVGSAAALIALIVPAVKFVCKKRHSTSAAP
jgi:hypothetical protein